jgi:hypothetical protein
VRLLDPPCAKAFEPLNLRGQVAGVDVEVHPGWLLAKSLHEQY